MLSRRYEESRDASREREPALAGFVRGGPLRWPWATSHAGLIPFSGPTRGGPAVCDRLALLGPRICGRAPPM
jgi:hypothetical protein